MKALVIGGTKGIGKATAERLRKDSHRVVVAARKPEGVDHPHVQLDLEWTSGMLKQAVDQAVSILDGLDWLVVSAGQSGMYASPHGDSEERARWLLGTNFIGRQQAIKAAARHLHRARGKAVVVTSDAVHRKAPGLALYKASHAALESWVTEVGKEYAGHGVALNAVAPGWVDGDITEGLPAAMKAKIIERSPIRRMLWCSEIAEVIYHVLQMPHVLTGTVIPVTAGFS